MDTVSVFYSAQWLLLWLWIFPASYVIHAAEEYWGGEGYTAYLFRLRGVHIPVRRFIILHLLALTFITALTIISQLLNFPEFMVAIFGGLMFSNGVSHTVTAIWDRGYGPGLITSILWIPLGAVMVYEMYGQITNLKLVIATAIGLAINGGVAFFTMKGGKL